MRALKHFHIRLHPRRHLADTVHLADPPHRPTSDPKFPAAREATVVRLCCYATTVYHFRIHYTEIARQLMNRHGYERCVHGELRKTFVALSGRRSVEHQVQAFAATIVELV